jgi:hypothetical protein
MNKDLTKLILVSAGAVLFNLVVVELGRKGLIAVIQ